MSKVWIEYSWEVAVGALASWGNPIACQTNGDQLRPTDSHLTGDIALEDLSCSK